MGTFIKTFDGELKRTYRIDTSACGCGSGQVEYSITEKVREGWHDGSMLRQPRRVQEVCLDKAECPDCGAQFEFYLEQP